MSVLRWHRLSALWKSWMFNQEPAEEQGQISEAPGNEAEPQKEGGNTLKDHNSDFQNVQNVDYTRQRSVGSINLNEVQKSELLQRSCSEPCSPVSNCIDQSLTCPDVSEGYGCCSSEDTVDCAFQVDNGSEGDDGLLQREGSQRRSRRRFRRVNPRGERELITDGQDPAGYSTVRAELFTV